MTRISLAVVLLLLILASISFAYSYCPGDENQLTRTLCDVYCMLYATIPVMAFVLMVLAGVAYGIGNFFGAEVRAKANSWAMSCITGAIIAIVIIIFSDILISNLIGPNMKPKC